MCRIFVSFDHVLFVDGLWVTAHTPSESVNAVASVPLPRQSLVDRTCTAVRFAPRPFLPRSSIEKPTNTSMILHTYPRSYPSPLAADVNFNGHLPLHCHCAYVWPFRTRYLALSPTPHVDRSLTLYPSPSYWLPQKSFQIFKRRSLSTPKLS